MSAAIVVNVTEEDPSSTTPQVLLRQAATCCALTWAPALPSCQDGHSTCLDLIYILLWSLDLGRHYSSAAATTTFPLPTYHAWQNAYSSCFAGWTSLDARCLTLRAVARTVRSTTSYYRPIPTPHLHKSAARSRYARA